MDLRKSQEYFTNLIISDLMFDVLLTMKKNENKFGYSSETGLL